MLENDVMRNISEEEERIRIHLSQGDRKEIPEYFEVNMLAIPVTA